MSTCHSVFKVFYKVIFKVYQGYQKIKKYIHWISLASTPTCCRQDHVGAIGQQDGFRKEQVQVQVGTVKIPMDMKKERQTWLGGGGGRVVVMVR